MNFLEIISKIISIIINFTVFYIVLVVIKKYYFDFLSIFDINRKPFKLFLTVKRLFYNQDISLREKILVENKLSIGNGIDNDIVLKSDCIDVVKLVIYVEKKDIYAEDFSSIGNIKVNNKNILGKIKLNGNEEIFILNILFQLMKEWGWIT